MKSNQTVLGYATDLIAVMRHVQEAMDRHVKDERLHKVTGARAALLDSLSVLERGRSALEVRVQEMGGPGAGAMKEMVTSVTGFLTGLYGQVRGETVSRMLRDDTTGLHFVMACATMLHATAGALGNVRMVETVAGIMKELPRCRMRVKELLPHAVVAELAEEHGDVNKEAAETTVKEVGEDWRLAEQIRNSPQRTLSGTERGNGSEKTKTS